MCRPARSFSVAGRAVVCGFLLMLCLAQQTAAVEPIVLPMPDAFQTLVNPNCSHCIDEAKSRAGDLRGDDPVLAWTRGKYEGGAIPIRFFLNPYRVISDTYGVFVFDPDAGFARGYEPSLDFTFYGWRSGIAVMRHKDGTLFSTLSGRAFEGPRNGERLKPIATLATTWGYWNKSYPGSVAYRMFEKYQPIELSGQDNADAKKTRGPVDPRLAENAEVLGVSTAASWKAYPLDSLPKDGGLIHDTLAGQDIAIFWYPATHTAVAYAMRLDGAEPTKSLKLEFDAGEPTAPFIDRESDSRFGIEGRAVSGPLKGRTLTWIDSVQCKWFAWAAEHPPTSVYSVAKGQPIAPNRPKQAAMPASRATELVFVVPDAVTPGQIENWRGQGFTALVALLDEDHSAEAYQAAAAAALSAKMDLYYWIEIARNKRLADAHPRWMASLGMHDDWLARFPAATKPKQGEVAKAYPWVPIGYAEAFQAHLRRVEQLLGKVPDAYRGLLLNDLQGGPASCGCGNLQCRWAIDYGVPETATRDGAADTAARFIGKVRDLAPGKQIIPIWMTECEERDLAQAPGGKSTGLCGNVPCATGTCPKAFAKQLRSLMNVQTGPVGLFTAQPAAERNAKFYGGPAGWILASVEYLDAIRLSPTKQGVPHEQLWLVVQGVPEDRDTEAAARAVARSLQPGAVVVARVPLDQSYEPRVIAVD
jgi:hypothetical protein